MRAYWLDHFCPPARAALSAFVKLQPADCLPLLESLSLPRVEGVNYESPENRVFGFGDVVGKLFRPGRWSRAALMDEVNFLNDLLDAGLSVVRPIGTPGEWEGIRYQLYERVPPPFALDPEVLTPDLLRAFVHLVARMHQVGAQRDAPHRPRFEPEETCLGLLDVIRDRAYIPDHLLPAYTDAVSRLIAQLVSASAGVPLQRIHNDPGIWNVIWRPQGPLMMDLDDFDVGPVATDLAIMHLPWRLSTISPDVSPEERARQQRAEILRLYREIEPFPEEWEALFEPLRTLRGLFFDAWFSARWTDPAFAQNYPKDNVTEEAGWTRRVEGFAARVAGARTQMYHARGRPGG